MSAEQKPAIGYLRVSSKEQAEQYSIPAQRRTVTAYAIRHGFEIREWFVDSHSAASTKRKEFARMIEYLELHRDCRTVIVEKTDRLSRNDEDVIRLSRLDPEIHLVAENLVLSRDAPVGQLLTFDLSLVWAKHYIRNLKYEIKKGMREKATKGLWPSAAQLGFLNVHGGKDVSIIPDPERAPIIQQLFRAAANDMHNGQALARFAYDAGLRSRKGTRVSKNQILAILRSEIYVGVVRWAGARSEGTHEPLVSRELFDRVQIALGGAKAKPRRHNFAYGGLMKCGTCGGMLSGDVKKKQKTLSTGEVSTKEYVFFHCGGAKNCPRVHYPERFFDGAFLAALQRMQLDRDLAARLIDELGQRHRAAATKAVETTDTMRAKHGKVQLMLEDACEARFAGTLSDVVWQRMSRKWESELDALEVQMATESTPVSDAAFRQAAAGPIELLQRAPSMWVTRGPVDRGRLLRMMVSNCVVADGTLSIQWRKPFDLLARGIENEKWWS